MSRALFLAVISCLLLTSCASYFVRKECEQTDWFEYGKSVAMKGDRLSGNHFIKKCSDAEANINYTALDQGFKRGMYTYCLPESVHALGKRGEFFTPDMCDGENLRLLKSRHQQGVAEYCHKSNGFSAGAIGKPYNQVCPKDLEKEFLPEFNRGRRKFLSVQITQKENEFDDLQREIETLERKRAGITYELSSLGNGKVTVREIKIDPVTRTQREEISTQEDEATKNRRDSLQRDIDRANREISEKQDAQRNLRKAIRELNAELLTLSSRAPVCPAHA